MNSSDAGGDFFESGIYYLKGTVLCLAEPASKQKVELSKYGLLEEYRDEVSAAEILFQSEKISDEMRSKLKALSVQLEKVCDNIRLTKRENLSQTDFETAEWCALRIVAKDLLESLERP